MLPPPALLQPTPAQSAFRALNQGMFIHFGINTFFDKEWSYGDLPLSGFSLEKADTDSWCETAREAGLRYLIFTTKHVDGFCNWPSAHTDYHIGRTRYAGDLLGQLAASAHKAGLKLGLYYCLWDAHHPAFTRDEAQYRDFVYQQIGELLQGYGDILCLWLDGFWKKQSSGWQKGEEVIQGETIAGSTSKSQLRDEAFIRAWRMEGAYRLGMDRLYAYIKSLQPNCLVFNNPTTAYRGVPLFPVDARCAEKGEKLATDRKIWNWLGQEVYLPLQLETTLSQKGDALFPSGNWFWHEWDHSVASLEQIRQWQAQAQRLDANLVINAGPMANGKLRPEDRAVLQAMGKG